MSVTYIICVILLLFEFVFLLRIVMSFFPISPRSAAGKVKDLTHAVTEPVVAPVRRRLPPTTGMFSGGGLAEMLVLLIVIVLIKITYPR